MNSRFDVHRPRAARPIVAGLACLLALMPVAIMGAEPGPAAQVKNAGPDTGRAALVDAGPAIAQYVERQAKGAENNLSKAEKRVREGKVVDALWHLATEPMPNDAGFAGQESDYLNAVGQNAANSPGGLGGAAAYAAWYTYRHTGNADLAFRVGVLSAATSQAFPNNGGMTLDAGGMAARRSAVAGAIGGMALAAAGGDQQAILEAFLRDGGMVLIHDGFKRYIGSKLVARSSDEDAYCMSAMGAECPAIAGVYVRDDKGSVVYKEGKPQLAPSQQRGNGGGARSAKWNDERSVFMQSPSTVQGMNAMTLFHEQWALSWDMRGIRAPTRLAPAILINYAGTGALYYELVKKTTTAQGHKTAGVRELELVAAVETRAPPLEFGSNSVSEAFICEDDGASNSLVVDQPDGTRANCRAVAIAGNGRVELIGEGNHVDECALKAESRIRDQIQFGQSCFIREMRWPGSLIKTASKDAAPIQAMSTPSSGILGPVGMTSLALFSGGMGYLARALRSRNKRKRRQQA